MRLGAGMRKLGTMLALTPHGLRKSMVGHAISGSSRLRVGPIGRESVGKFRRNRSVVSILTIASMMAGPALADPISLDQALSRGLERSPEVGQAQARIGAAEAARDQAKRSWFPTIELDGAVGLRHLENDARVNLGLSSLDEKPLYATIGVSQPVFDFGRRSNETKARNARLNSAGWEEQAAGEEIAYGIARAYLQVLVQQRIVQSSQDNLGFHIALAADVSEGVDKGAMSISERQQAQERVQGAKISLAQANADLATATSELTLLVGAANIEVSTPPDASAKLPGTLDLALTEAAASDPRLLAMGNRLDEAKWLAKRARSELLPLFGLQGKASGGKDFEGYRGTTRDYSLLFSMRWNLFDGGVTAARIREAERHTDEAGFALAQTRRDSELQVRKAWIGLENWRSRLENQQTRFEAANAVRDTYRAQFGIGRRSLLDLLDAQGAVYNASVEAEAARAGTLLAEYGLLAQLGRLRAFFGIAKTTVDPKLYGPR